MDILHDNETQTSFRQEADRYLGVKTRKPPLRSFDLNSRVHHCNCDGQSDDLDFWCGVNTVLLQATYRYGKGGSSAPCRPALFAGRKSFVHGGMAAWRQKTHPPPPLPIPPWTSPSSQSFKPLPLREIANPDLFVPELACFSSNKHQPRFCGCRV